MSLKLVFMGTPAFAVPTLEAILAAGHQVAAVYTKPPRPAGRRLQNRPSPVHNLALARGLVVKTPSSLRSETEHSEFLANSADAAVVAAYGLLLPKPLLDAPRFGCFNVHASLLPRWRGAAPINRAIMAGDSQTGVTIMQMSEGLDEGPICLAKPILIGERDTAGELHDKLAVLGASLMVEALDRLERNRLSATPQPVEGATYAEKISPADAHIDFGKPALGLLRHVHGLSPRPGAWAAFDLGGKPQRIRILAAEPAEGRGAPGEIIDDRLAIACGDGAIRPLRLQREGKAVMSRDEFLRGAPVNPGDRLR